MEHRILTLDDLVKFCGKQNFTHFDAKESGYKLNVRIPSQYSEIPSSDGLIMYGKVKLFHTGRNRNGSNVTREAAKRSLSSIKYKPVLANFCEVDGVKDFTSHDINIGDDGKIVYNEKQVGCFTADKPLMEYDEKSDRYYVYATVAIPREYTDAAEIIERKGGTKVSAEIAINTMTYISETKELVLEDIEIAGMTLLGLDPKTKKEVQEGMEGARLDIIDFSEEKNGMSFEQDEKIIKTLEKINNALSVFNKNNEGGTGLAEKEKKAKENTEEKPKNESMSARKITYSIGNKTFELPLDKIQETINMLVNNTYATDGTYYSTICYPNEVVMIDTWTDKAFRQEYTEVDGVYNLVGERVPVTARWVTKEESDKLDEAISGYPEMQAELAKYKDEPKKTSILGSDEYRQIFDNEDYIKLKEDHFDMSVEEVKDKADSILLQYAKTHPLNFSADENRSLFSSMKFGAKEQTESRYGDLFANKIK